MHLNTKNTLLAVGFAAAGFAAHAAGGADAIGLKQLGVFETGSFDEGAAEIVAYDPANANLLVINADEKTVDLINIASPTNPTLVGEIDVEPDIKASFPGSTSGGVNSVAVSGQILAVAVENDDKQANGWAAFYTTGGDFLGAVEVGALPDSITFTPNGRYALVANEGEPSDDYQNDPEGTISVIDLRPNGASIEDRVATADFNAFDDSPPAGVRLPRPYGASVSQDLEPEFVVADNQTAWVTLQENNALAIVDIKTATVTGVVPLGVKDHSQPGSGLDASNRDDAINITNWPVFGTYMPDGMTRYYRGATYLITANEGDGREYFFDTSEAACTGAGLEFDEDDGCLAYIDEARIKDLDLDPTAFPNAGDLQEDENLGRLKALLTEGDTDGDGDYDFIQSFGARSISIWDAAGNLVGDTGDMFEVQTAAALTDCAPGEDLEDCSGFNSTNDENDSFDSRSDDKGPEPEGVVVGRIRGRDYAFVGLERVGGVMIVDVSDPANPAFENYVNNRNFDPELDVEDGGAGDLGPEGILFIKGDKSPTGKPLVVTGSEVSGTTTIYEVTF